VSSGSKAVYYGSINLLADKKDFKVFVINLDKDFEKREWIKNHFTQREIPFEFIRGVYGKTIKNQELIEKFDYKNAEIHLGRVVSLNEVGCALSHQKVYKKIIDDNLDGAFIFEDDVFLSENALSIIQNMHKYRNSLPDNVWVSLTESYIYRRRKILEIGNVCSVFETFRAGGAFGYWIDQGAAKVLSHLNTPIIFIADHYRGYISKINKLSIDPCFVGHGVPKLNIQSTIAETRRKVNKKGFLKLKHRRLRVWSRVHLTPYADLFFGIKKVVLQPTGLGRKMK